MRGKPHICVKARFGLARHSRCLALPRLRCHAHGPRHVRMPAFFPASGLFAFPSIGENALMSAEVLIGVVSAGVSVLGAVAAGLMGTWSAQRTRRYERLLDAQQKASDKAEQAEAVLSRYREPLLLAAENLHSRIFSIVKNKILLDYLQSSDPDLQRYGREYTVYVLAEYLCWAEIIRRDLRFLDLGTEERNRDLVRKLENVQMAMSDTALPRAIRLFRGEQRAIGEIMMTPSSNADGAQSESLGYVQFCARLDEDLGFANWFLRLREGMDDVAAADGLELVQLIKVQHHLIDLIEFLDPQHLRLPARKRDRLPLPSQREATRPSSQGPQRQDGPGDQGAPSASPTSVAPRPSDDAHLEHHMPDATTKSPADPLDGSGTNAR
jgi:hypothetical protein